MRCRRSPGDVRIVAPIDPGVAGTLVEENPRRTPTERLRRMREMRHCLVACHGDAEIAEIRERAR